MSSDSEDDEQLKQFLEAADTTLLSDSMFQRQPKEDSKSVIEDTRKVEELSLTKDIPKSQRYIVDEEDNNGYDFHVPESMQKHVAKKLSAILDQTYEFCNVSGDSTFTTKKSKAKNRVRLLKGDDVYVNSYEDYEYETKGPTEKPVIKRRCLDESNEIDNEDIMKALAISGEDIMAGIEVKNWATKKERKDKVFKYRAGERGVLHAKEEENEFTAMRRKNKWNETKIKTFKKTKQ